MANPRPTTTMKSDYPKKNVQVNDQSRNTSPTTTTLSKKSK